MAAILTGCGASATPTPAPVGPSPTAVMVPPATGPVGAASPAASPGPSAVAATYPLTLTDDEGTAVTILAMPRTIVSLTPATTEILFAVGAGPRVGGVTDADDYPPAAKKVTQVVKLGSVDVEKIVGLGADLVVAGGNGFNSPEAIAKLRSLGIPVIVVYASDVAGVYRDIAARGDRDRRRRRPVTRSWHRCGRRRQAVVAAVAAAGAPRPRVFYELDATKDIYTFADGIEQDELIRLAGGDPITTGSTSAFSIPLEKLVVADPQLILLGDAAYGTTAAQVTARPGWEGMTAVRTGAIRPIDDTLVSRPGPRVVEALRALARAINPALVLPPIPTASAAP